MDIKERKGPEGIVKAVCTSERKGVEKHSVEGGFFMEDFGTVSYTHLTLPTIA